MLKRFLSLSLLLISTNALAALPDIDSPHRTGHQAPDDAAVVISVEHYPFLKVDVPFASRDGDAFETLLLYTRGVPKARVRRLSDAHSADIQRAVAEAAAETQGTLWVYFAGHAALNAEGERVLVGADVPADERLMDGHLIRLPELLEVAAKSPAKSVVVVLDACNTSLGKRPLIPTAALTVPAKVSVWSATSAQEQAGPLPGAPHGAFTYAVIGALRGWADGELTGVRDGQVALQEAEPFVLRFLKEQSVRSQTPSLAGERSLILSGGQERLAQSAPPEPEVSRTAAWLWTGSTVALAAASAYFWISAGEHQDTVDARYDDYQKERDSAALNARYDEVEQGVDDVNRARLIAGTLGGLAVLTAGLACWEWLTPVSITPNGVGVGGQF